MCKESVKLKEKEKRHNRILQGLCSCGNIRDSKKKCCQRCLEKVKINKARLREERKARKLCTLFGKPTEENRIHCKDCRIKDNESNNKIRLEVLQHYGNYCMCCGESQIEFLCIDHINNDGYKHLMKCGRRYGGYVLCKWLKKHNYPKDFQILCWNCNLAKHLFGICPHQITGFKNEKKDTAS